MVQTIEIPFDSYTALRLTYADPKFLNKHGKVVLLGKVPSIWTVEDHPGFVRSLAKKARKKVGNLGIRNSIGLVISNLSKYDDEFLKPIKSIPNGNLVLDTVKFMLENESDWDTDNELEEGEQDEEEVEKQEEHPEQDYHVQHDDHMKKDKKETGDQALNTIDYYHGDESIRTGEKFTKIQNFRPRKSLDKYKEPHHEKLPDINVDLVDENLDNDDLLKEFINAINENNSKRNNYLFPSQLPDIFDIDHNLKSGKSSLDAKLNSGKTSLDIELNNNLFSESLKSHASPICDDDGVESAIRSVSSIVDDSKSDQSISKLRISTNNTSINDTTIPTPNNQKNFLSTESRNVILVGKDHDSLDHLIVNEIQNPSNGGKISEILIQDEKLDSSSSDEEYYTASLENSLLRSNPLNPQTIELDKENMLASSICLESQSNKSLEQESIINDNQILKPYPHTFPTLTKSIESFENNSSHLSDIDLDQNYLQIPSSLSVSPLCSIASKGETSGKVNKLSHQSKLSCDFGEVSNNTQVLGNSLKKDRVSSQKSSIASIAVKWDSLVPKRNRKCIISVTPQPISRIDFENFIERRDSKMLHRLKKIASKSKSKYTDKRNSYKERIFSMAMKKYRSGQVIRSCQMLVMVKSLQTTKALHPFTEYEYCDSRVIDRWKEYQVVIRKTDDDSKPIRVELYGNRGLFNNKKNEANYLFNVDCNILAQFYSDTDKTILVVIPSEEGEPRAFIFRTHNQVIAFRWLFMLKMGQSYNFDSSITINIPKLAISLVLQIPYEVIYNLLRLEKNTKIHILPSGYRVEYSPFLEYIREYIENELAVRNKNLLNDFSSYYEKPWFCYKRYDLLEWVQNNSQSFYVQSKLFGYEYSLQIRDVGHYPSKVKIGDEIVEEPVPIEGFLSRLSNISGKETSFFRSFFKVLYFFTSKNLLFYTRYFKAIPPSPENNFINDENVVQTINGLPQIYECSTFPISENDHIDWLNENDFQYHDKLAKDEYVRKAEQIVKADGFIDMARIKEIRAIPLRLVTKTQKVLHCLYWYNNAELIEDNFFIDSGFELLMHNGSKVKLLAPNKIIRDEWIYRLNELRNYWKFRRREDIISRIKLKEYNQKVLNISEYHDANVSYQVEVNELFNSEADSCLDNIDSIALLSCILNHGYLFQKSKKHANFNWCYAILVPGYILLFHTYKRSKLSGKRKKQAIFQHYLTIPIGNCYVYSGISTEIDLLDRKEDLDPTHPGRHSLPRVYADGWKSSEEEHMLCFTLWIGNKRKLRGKLIPDKEKPETIKNPGIAKMVTLLGLTGKSFVFMARSRQEQASWTQSILSEADRYRGGDEH